MKDLFIFRKVEPDVTVMDFTGRLTTPAILVAEVEHFIKKRIENGARKIVLDLSKVDYIDSSGVGMLVVCATMMEQAGGRLVIGGAAGTVKRVLEMVHLERSIGMHADVASACRALADSPAAPAGA